MSFVNIFSVITILIIFDSICSATANSKTDNNHNKEGLHIYKNLIQNKNGDEMEDIVGDDAKYLSKMLYLYHPPGPSDYDFTDGSYQKRAVNRFKSLILSRGNVDSSLEEDDDSKETPQFMSRYMPKRYPGAILSWAIPAANRVRTISAIYRPPGISRPAA